ncbi:MAG: biotin--[acetyl-CoA-carboxylase] ligase, partial [Dehalococcoidales bacterium]|nr:biotin--[acetyl-CoA-carboxylase] ligase [Dehalococcoidales bacterium]
MENILSAASITNNLPTRLIGQTVVYYPTLTSTNDIAKQEARQGALTGTVVVADEQTGGKGRLKRVWLSPDGCIALSIVLRPDIAHLSSLIMLASLGVVRSIQMTTGLKAQVKWPNDVLVN